MPFAIRWPGKIAAGGVSDEIVHEMDLFPTLAKIVGGEVHEYAKLIAESREQTLDRMTAEARSLGANAIIATRFTTSVMAAGAAELLAVGTAVVIEPEAASE